MKCCINFPTISTHQASTRCSRLFSESVYSRNVGCDLGRDFDKTKHKDSHIYPISLASTRTSNHTPRSREEGHGRQYLWQVQAKRLERGAIIVALVPEVLGMYENQNIKQVNTLS
jgi:hypothetical protein